MPTNHAMWLPSKGAELVIGEAPYPRPKTGQIVVAAAALSANPIDWILQVVGSVIFPWLRYPVILGSDVAGEVVAVGPAVTRFAVGDRVLGHAVGQDKSVNDAAEGAFQNYVVLRDHMASPLPADMRYETGVVLPLALSTAACGLFQDDQLALAPPRQDAKSNGQTVLVWGGATSVGSNAIQLATAAGYEVFATASPKNHDYVRKLGAVRAFDYRSPAVVRDLQKAMSGRTVAGAMAIGTGAAAPCLDIMGACKGNRFVAVASTPVSFDDAPAGGGRLYVVGKVARMILANLELMLRARRRGARFKFMFGTTLLNNGVGRMIYEDFLPSALASGRYQAVPQPQVVGHGLQAIPEALAIQKKGVSARKVIVTL